MKNVRLLARLLGNSDHFGTKAAYADFVKRRPPLWRTRPSEPCARCNATAVAMGRVQAMWVVAGIGKGE